MWKDEISHLFVENKIKFHELSDLGSLNSMKIGGKALILALPSDEDQLVFVLREARHIGAPFQVIGGMTNTLICDGVFCGVLIKTSCIDSMNFTKNREVYATCGTSLASVVRGAAKRGIGGFSEMVGIPGTLGGAIYGNAGAHGRAISEAVVEVNVYDTIENKKKTLTRRDIEYAYRDSLFKRERRYVILSARLRGFAADRDVLKAKMSYYTKIRRQRQPLSMPSLGSIFKHPSGDFAPRLIESLGLKGLRVGGAEISKIHAGFIVNVGGATASDVKKLIKIIKAKVKDTYGIDLEEEINYLVQGDENVLCKGTED